MGRLLNEFFNLSVYIPVRIDAQRKRKTTVAVETENFVSALTVMSAWHYLRQRFVDERDVITHQIGVCVEKGHTFYSRIIFPLEDYWTGRVVGFIARSYTGGHPKYLTDIEEKIIVGYRHRGEQVHVLVEGLFDALVVHRAGRNAAALLGTSSQDVEQWAARVPIDNRIAIMLDGEAEKDAQKLYWRIKPIHPNVFVVPLPAKTDPADFDPIVIDILIRKHTTISTTNLNGG